MKEHELIESKARRLTWWGLNTEIDRIKAALARPDTKQLGRWKKRLAIMEAQLANRIKPGCRPAGGFTLLELLCVLSVIAILMAMVVPTFARAYRTCAAQAAWIEYWESTRKVMIAELPDRVPPATDRFWLQTWSEAYRGIYGTQRWAQVSMDQVRQWRTLAKAAAGVYDRTNAGAAH